MFVRVCVRPVFEGYFSEEPLPYSDPTGAAGGGNCRLDSPSQESRLQAQRIRGPDSRGHGHTPQNRPPGHQPPDLPEGYGQSRSSRVLLHVVMDPSRRSPRVSSSSTNRTAHDGAGPSVLPPHADGRQHLARPSDTTVRPAGLN